MKIAVDIDEVLADLLNQIILFHNEKYGTNFKRDDFYSYSYHEVWGGTIDQAIGKVEEFFDTNYFKETLPIKGALPSLLFLKEKGHDLFLITGRKYEVEEETKNWIEKYFPNIFSGIYHTNTYAPSGIRIDKSKVCKELGISLIIDDDILHVKDCTGEGVEVLVYDSPWNQVGLPTGATRVFDWDEIVKIILQK